MAGRSRKGVSALGGSHAVAGGGGHAAGGGGYAWWERHGPRLPSNGIKAHSRRGAFGTSWWAGRWVAALERLVNPARLARGRAYARAGQVLSLHVEPGLVRARVQGSRVRPYDVAMHVATLPDADWERVVDRLSGEALYAARLLSGEMPEQIEDLFASLGLSLFPADGHDLQTSCSCPDWANPCKHVAAVHYLLGERFDEDPFLILLLRGRDRDTLLAALRARRSDGEADEADPSPDPEAPALATVDPAAFWRAPGADEEVALHFALPERDALPVGRLGPAPFVRDQEALLAAMARMYRRVSEYALLLAVSDADVPPPAD